RRTILDALGGGLVDLAEPLADLGPVGAHRRLLRAPGLEEVTRGGQVRHRDRARVQQEAHVVGCGVGRRTADDEAADLTPPYGQQSLRLEDADRFAQARSAGRVLLQEYRLRGQLRAVGQISLNDPQT